MIKVTTYRKFTNAGETVRTVTEAEAAQILEAYGVPMRERGERGSYTYGEDVILWEPVPAPIERPAASLRAFGIMTGRTVNVAGRVVKVTARRIIPGRVEFLFSDGTRQAFAPGTWIEICR